MCPPLRLMYLLIAMLLAACSMAAVAPTPSQIVSASSEPSDTPGPTKTPFVMPTPPPPPTPRCEDAPRTRLIIGERGRVLDDDPRPVRQRSLPSLLSEIVASIPPDGIFFV